ncbi:hypothetical protein Xoosp13_139 [Xanthomonas phage Xoo-sp13]|nr:hypothetical protein Xoosp13_139 [Xanthomonas phage Xoo-sp13]
MVNGKRDDGVSIYINERLVGIFATDSRMYPRLYPIHNRRVEGGDVYTAMLAFIKKWEIGV